jgi:hypothetical protein
MPKIEIDYSNTIIYKIFCKDPLVTDVYVGHTTNFVQRKYAHKQSCINPKSSYYNLKLYKIIRENGNWSNWEMSIINFYNCKDQYEARQKEQEHFKILSATLNSIEPMPMKKENAVTITETIVVPKTLNTSKKFCCETCNYNTSNKNDWKKHLATGKHKTLTETKNKTDGFKCECGNIYKYDSGYYRHKKKCVSKVTINTESNEKEVTDKELIMLLLKQNAQLIEQNTELCKNGINSNNMTNNNNNSHNKTFNLQFFLHEECKDALNISEFVNSIKVELDDLETTGRLGYVEGVSRIINKNLGDLDQTKRPIHCSDVKREILYIKDDDQWVKENDNKPILTKAIRQIANENIKQIGEWRKKYPDCTASDSRKNDTYLNIVSNAMSGTTSEEQSKNYEKIITKVAKEVTIEK